MQRLCEADEAASLSPRVRLSSIGKCPRENWARLNGQDDERPPGAKALAIFQMGHAVEPHVVDLLRLGGYSVREVDDDGNQFTVEMIEGQAIGHIDGMVEWGRGVQREWKLLEVKSAKQKKFTELEEAGSYATWNPGYGDQIQAYMGATQEPHSKVEPLRDCLVIVLNKDTSERWTECIRFDPERYAELKKNALAALGEEMPERPAKANGQYSKFCKWCSVAAWCYSPMAGVEFDA